VYRMNLVGHRNINIVDTTIWDMKMLGFDNFWIMRDAPARRSPVD
jgi:hypothetical protein